MKLITVPQNWGQINRFLFPLGDYVFPQILGSLFPFFTHRHIFYHLGQKRNFPFREQRKLFVSQERLTQQFFKNATFDVLKIRSTFVDVSRDKIQLIGTRQMHFVAFNLFAVNAWGYVAKASRYQTHKGSLKSIKYLRVKYSETVVFFDKH